MAIVMKAYYLVVFCLIGLLGWNFVREKRSRDDMVLYLVVLIPLLLRLFRVK